MTRKINQIENPKFQVKQINITNNMYLVKPKCKSVHE